MTKIRLVYLASFLILSASFGFKAIQSFNSAPAPHHAQSSPTDSLRANVAEWQVLYDSLDLADKGLSPTAFAYAWYGFQKMKFTSPIMAIADFSQSSTRKRLYIVDMNEKKLLVNTFVAHGRNSGNEYARKFSNANESYQSSLGFYRTLGTYQGKHGLSLRLEGLEKGINDKAFERAIVMHGANYVSESFIKNTGRLGRSLGCPAISLKDHKKVIKLLYNGAGLFIYSKDKAYLNGSKLLATIQSQLSNDQPSESSLRYTSSI
ncbi:L,D-transpeptidase-like protein [Dyadobacter jejuensis]|uniref:L,D-transpeptidase-like protein n=1 Tax=Dyadobacter jejuensis TaxID=1082580 RepID=A0A316AIY8_9BACT|nr:murein L,D-transpeptidase catalytic domain family protein [Dyadobacter jejuensis]PWJ57199.1 L,D-transpeptidase-like protein [Dyadobacter jejuensis]